MGMLSTLHALCEGIHQSLVDSPDKVPVVLSFGTEQAFQETLQLLVVWEVTMLKWDIIAVIKTVLFSTSY